MKKTISLLLAVLLCAGNLFAETKRVYCKMTYNWWTDASAAVGIYSFKGTTEATSWPGVRMTAVAGEEGLWYADVDITTYPSVIFTRINGSGTVSYWGAQTNDLTIPTGDQNCYTITSSSAQWSDKGNKCTGSWSTYTPPTTLPTYYITGNANVVGTSVKEWSADAIELGEATAEKPATYTFTTLPADTCRLKVTDGTWNVFFGYNALDKDNSSANILTDKDDNIVFVPQTANTDVKLTFNGTNIILTGDFASATPVKTLTAYYVNTTSWTTVNAYVYAGANNNTWPGAAMTKTELTKNGYDVYSYEFAETYTNIIFNDGGSNQTADLTIDASKLYYYSDTWYASLDDIPEPCTPDYGVMVGENYTAATINPENPAEYMLTELSLKKDDTFTLYDNCAKAAWVITTFKEGSTSNITVVDNKYVVGATGTYDIYFELSYGADKIYIGYTASTPTAIIEVNGIAADEPMYNLLGVRVDNTYRGIVIQGGKKYFLK